MNVIDDTKLQTAAVAVTDNAAKQIVTQILPVAGALIDAAVTKLCDEATLVVGSALADITAERKELVNDIHGLLDRINGTGIAIVNGKIQLMIPPRT